MGDEYIEYFQQLYERLNEAVRVSFRQVHLDSWRPLANRCHDNVDYWVAHHTGCEAVRGWLFWPPDQSGRCRFMAHSVVQENGVLIDITPMDNSTPRETLFFLRHLGTDAEFAAMKTNYSEQFYPLITFEEWHQSQTPPETNDKVGV